MANIEYRLSGSFLPIFATLRQNDINGAIIDSKVLHVSGQLETFSGVTVGTYAVVGYDRAFGSDSKIVGEITTTTIPPIVKFDNGRVTSIIETSGGDYLVGGLFTGYTNTETNGVILLNKADGTKNTSFGVPTSATSTLSSVFGLIEDTTTGVYLVMGGFETYSGSTETDVVSVNISDGKIYGGWGNWSDTTSHQTGVIGAILVPTSKYLFYGGFWGLDNDTNQNKVSKTDISGAFDGGFSVQNPSSFNNTIYDAILTSSGTYLVVGAFTDFNGDVVNRIAQLNVDGSLNVTETNIFGTGFNGTVFSIILTSTNQYLVAGSFTIYNGTSRNGLILLNLDGTIDDTLNIGVGFGSGSPISVIETNDGNYLASGTFLSYNGTPRNRIIKILSNGTIDNTFNVGTGFNAQVDANIIETSDGYYLFGGQFTTYKGDAHKRFIKLTSTGSVVW